jgi:hypothetical protein
MNLKFQKLYFKSLKNQKFKFTFKKKSLSNSWLLSKTPRRTHSTTKTKTKKPTFNSSK